ncbi:MAG: LacI family transcriptional regulator [Bacteroidia bacterium]|nr:LacI family transcriptional regulator [Bacteroidia bacterium]
MKSQITIKDIARELNISASTVSRALQDHPDISKATKEAVNEYAKKYHYKPNAIALSLKMKHTNVIGVLVPEMVHHFFSSVFAGIEDVANEKGYNVIVCQTSEKYEKEVKNVETLISARVSGVLASISKETEKYDHFQELIDDGTPLVFFDRICTGLKTDRVIADDYTGAYNAVEHLIKTGCKRIAFYGAPANLEISKNRKNGYIDALRANSIGIDNGLIFECDSRDSAIELTPAILKEANRPDAFFAINDDTASGILYATKRAGLSVPEDISICGFGDGVIARTSDPELTTVQQNGYEMGVESCKMLLSRIQEDNDPTQVIHRVIRTNLIKRGTTR